MRKRSRIGVKGENLSLRTEPQPTRHTARENGLLNPSFTHARQLQGYIPGPLVTFSFETRSTLVTRADLELTL